MNIIWEKNIPENIKKNIEENIIIENIVDNNKVDKNINIDKNIKNDKLLKKYLSSLYFIKNSKYYHFKISHKLVNILKKIPYEKGIVCDDVCYQHEVFGVLDITDIEKVGNIKDVRNIKNTPIFILGECTVNNGNKESTDVLDHKITYHSHPYSAYKKYNDSLGWPSSDDYMTFMRSTVYFSAICHIILTLEGVYILSIKESYNKDDIKKYIEKIDDDKEFKEYIISLLDIPKVKVDKVKADKKKILKDYIYYINYIDFPLKLDYFSWDLISKKIFSIYNIGNIYTYKIKVDNS